MPAPHETERICLPAPGAEAEFEELVFEIRGGADTCRYVARCVQTAIFKQADNRLALRRNIIDAVECHFDDQERPPFARLDYLTDERLAAYRPQRRVRTKSHDKSPA